jgi:hypothetical protein
MCFRKRYTVSAWRYIDKFYVKFYHRNSSYGYSSYYINAIQIKAIHDWYLNGADKPIEITDSSLDKALISLEGLYQINSEQQKEFLQKEYKTLYDAECEFTLLKNDGSWQDLKLKEE